MVCPPTCAPSPDHGHVADVRIVLNLTEDQRIATEVVAYGNNFMFPVMVLERNPPDKLRLRLSDDATVLAMRAFFQPGRLMAARG
jgi:hypothetical protein